MANTFHVKHRQMNLIAKIYEAVLNPAPWTEILDDMCVVTGARGLALFAADRRHEELQFGGASSILEESVTRDYWENCYDYDLPYLMTITERPAGKIVADIDLIGGFDTLHKLPSTIWLDANFGVYRRNVVRLCDSKSWLPVMTFFYANDRGPMAEAEINDASVMLPHLANAVRLTRPFQLLRIRFQAVLSVLDRFHVGVFILAKNGTIMLKNAEADRILDPKDCLSIDVSGRLRAHGNASQNSLAAAIQATRDTARGAGDETGALLTVSRRSGQDPLLLEIAPLRDRGLDFDGRVEGTLVLVIDPANRHMISSAGLNQLYGLSAAETAVCQLLLEGHDVETIAEMRNVKPSTVRSQLIALFQKTGSKRQSDLIRLALSVNLPVDAAPQ